MDKDVEEFLKTIVTSDKAEDKENVKIINPPGYSLAYLRDAMEKDSVLAQRCDLTTNNIPEMCKSVLALLQNDVNMQELASIYAAACMLYATAENPYDFLMIRTNLLNRAFQEADTLIPYHIDYFVGRLKQVLLNSSDVDNEDYVLNVLQLLPELTSASETGKLIAVGLALYILADITGNKLKIYCFKNFKEIISMLKNLNIEELVNAESPRKVYIVVHAAGFILNNLAFGQNDILVKAGYRQLKLTVKESHQLYSWFEKLRLALGNKALNQFEAKWTFLVDEISQYLMLSILNSLECSNSTYDKIETFDKE